jgi:hypothetical protein
MAIRYARWEPPSFGYRLRNSSAQATANGPESVLLAKVSRRDIETDNSRPQAGARG